MAGGTTYKLTHATAYESNFDGEADVYMIVLSSRPISPADIKKVKAGEKDGDTYDYPRPFMKLEFTKKEGKLLSWSGGAGNTSFGRGTALRGVKSELKVGEGRLSGSASQPEEGRGGLSSAFDVRFDVALPGVTAKQPDKPSAASAGTVSGTFLGDGKEAKLAHVRAFWDRPQSGKRRIRLVFTEEDPKTEGDPGLAAIVKKLGSCLSLSVFEDGTVSACDVAHKAHRGAPFKAPADVKVSNLQVQDGKVSGEIATAGEVTTRNNRWEVKLQFTAPLAKPER
jgi:hypothetical protein